MAEVTTVGKLTATARPQAAVTHRVRPAHPPARNQRRGILCTSVHPGKNQMYLYGPRRGRGRGRRADADVD